MHTTTAASARAWYAHNIYHHHRPLIPLCGIGTTCFLLPFSSITRHLHAHSLYFHVIIHTVHPSFPRLISTRVPIYIHTHHSFCYVTYLHTLTSFYPAGVAKASRIFLRETKLFSYG
jgi:hypothetical protein